MHRHELLILWSICWSSSLVHFKNGSEYLTAQVFIPLISFLLCSLLSGSFLVLLRSFCVFSPSALIFSLFGSSIPSIVCRFPLFIISMVYFSMPSSIPISWLYILTVCIRVPISFSFLANSLLSSMYIGWVIFFLRFVKFLSTCAFPMDVIQWHHYYYK